MKAVENLYAENVKQVVKRPGVNLMEHVFGCLADVSVCQRT